MSMSVGASGAVYGLLGAYLTHRYMNRHHWPIQSDELMFLAQIFGINLLLTWVANVDHWGHVGGALGGAAFVYYLQTRGRSGF